MVDSCCNDPYAINKRGFTAFSYQVSDFIKYKFPKANSAKAEEYRKSQTWRLLAHCHFKLQCNSDIRSDFLIGEVSMNFVNMKNI